LRVAEPGPALEEGPEKRLVLAEQVTTEQETMEEMLAAAVILEAHPEERAVPIEITYYETAETSSLLEAID
jgi:hypothetical protein